MQECVLGGAHRRVLTEPGVSEISRNVYGYCLYLLLLLLLLLSSL